MVDDVYMTVGVSMTAETDMRCRVQDYQGELLATLWIGDRSYARIVVHDLETIDRLIAELGDMRRQSVELMAGFSGQPTMTDGLADVAAGS